MCVLSFNPNVTFDVCIYDETSAPHQKLIKLITLNYENRFCESDETQVLENCPRHSLVVTFFQAALFFFVYVATFYLLHIQRIFKNTPVIFQCP
jgi:hypothetical protein